MSDVKHTPGPWKVGYRSLHVLAENAKIGGDTPVCDIRGWGYLTGKGHGALGLPAEEAVAIQDANARLIAAAPEMLEALKGLDAYWSADFPEGPDGSRVALGGFGTVSDDTMQVWRNVRAALAKASGETP